MRIPRRLMVRFGAGSGTDRGLVENLSPTGLCLTCKRVFTPGTVLTIELLADRSSCPLVGVVRWARQLPGTIAHVLPSSMGIQLESPSEEYLTLVRRVSGPSREPRQEPEKRNAGGTSSGARHIRSHRD